MKIKNTIFCCLIFLISFSTFALDLTDIIVSTTNDNKIELFAEFDKDKTQTFNGELALSINGEDKNIKFKDGKAQIDAPEGKHHLFVKAKFGESSIYKFLRIKKDANGKISTSEIPLWMSLLPPLIAIIMALILREVVLSLFIGIFSGAFILNGFSFSGFFDALVSVVDTYIVKALTDSGHASVIIFSLLIGGMVAIISRNGGMAGVVEKLAGFANSPRNSQLVTWFLGVAIFFDDYANTLIVGNTVRPMTDKHRVSREKLAYIVDSTAAPVAAVAFITTWIGAEIGYISGAIEQIDGLSGSAYGMFLSSLNYAFYPILTLIFILMLVFMQKDYGPMYKAEVRARTTGQLYSSKQKAESENDTNMDDLSPIEGIKHNWYNAFIPVMMVILITIIGLVSTGMASSFSALVEKGVELPNTWGAIWENINTLDPENSKLGILIGNSDSYVALLWASLAGVVSAILLSFAGRIMNLEKAIATLLEGIQTMMPAIIILVLAWSLASITEELHTADYLSQMIAGNISPYLMPMLTFILAAAIAFATGSSWGTMAILYPLMLPATWAVCQTAGLPTETAMPIFYNVISCVLAGAVFGDHCSPISDTTILSSLATNCNHIDHVRTQLPYAITVGIVSIALGYFSVFVGLPSIINFAIGVGILFLVIKFMGKQIPDSH